MDKEKLNPANIIKAKEILGLEEEATLYEIKKAYHKLALKYHPDKVKKEEKKQVEEKFKQINSAYKLISNYITNYRISFRNEDIKRMLVDKKTHDHLKRFYDDWWGKI